MPTCQKCNEKWTWKQTIKKATFTFSGGMTCPYCNEKQYVTMASRKKGSIYAIFPLFAFLLNVFFDISLGIAIVLAVTFALVIIAINPMLVELSNEEEPLF